MATVNTSAIVLSDEYGLFIRVGSRKYRPGQIAGFDNLMMDHGDIKLRQPVRFSPVNYQGHAFVAVVTPRGRRVWSGLPFDHELRREKAVDMD